MSISKSLDKTAVKGSRENPRHILSISGGKDSAALAVYMKQNYDIPDVEYVFMDTEQELIETYEYLEKLEGVLEKEIIRLKPERSFDEYVKLHNGYLPSAQQRWCTINMKIKPFEKFVGDDFVYSYIGIRADENRDGYISAKGNVEPVYPFISDGINKSDVFRILEESGLGIPDYYKWRSRSGCYFCFFQQQIEWVGLAENHPDLFEKAKKFEKSGANGERPYNWTERGNLDSLVARKEEIKSKHKIALASKKKLGKGAKLIDILREVDPMVDADNFDEVMRDADQGEGCLVCTL